MPFLRHLRKHGIRGAVRRLVGDLSSLSSFERDLRSATPVLVYQMGKVGSSSIYRSLLKQYPGAVLHTHGFSPKKKNARLRRLHRWVFDEEKPLLVVSLTREPIARNLSAFFENFTKEAGVACARSRLSHEELRSVFLSRHDHDLPLEWFDKVILQQFGIDVFATPFPSRGVALYSRRNVRLLVMRCELPDSEKCAAIGDFLSLPGFELRNTNVGDEKAYASLYKAFRDWIVLPADYVDRMCTSKYFTHFYSKESIDAARRRWTRA